MESRLYKLLCIDVDGTLLDSNRTIPEENMRAIQEAYKAGIRIAIASGRTPSSVKEILNDLCIDGYGICLNGSYIMDSDKIISNYALSTKQVNVISKIVEKYNVKSFFSTATFNITNRAISDDRLTRQEQLIICHNGCEFNRILSKYNESILKASITEPNGKKYQKVKRELKGTNIFDVAQSDAHSIDINTKGINKSRGVRDLAEYLNIDLQNIICIGDNENDIEMVKAAGLGIAMANSCKELRNVSDAITLSNNECGVAKVIYDYVMN